MKKSIIIFLCLLPLLCTGQGKTDADIIAAISGSGREMSSLECDFVQIRHSKMLSEDMLSHGRMSYRKPDMLSWEYTDPYRRTFVMDGNEVAMKDADGKVMPDSGSRKAFREIARMMIDNLMGRTLTDSKAFLVETAEDGGEWVVTLTPQRKDLRQMLMKMVMHYDRKLKSVVKVEMTEKSGDSTVIEFKNIRYGTAR